MSESKTRVDTVEDVPCLRAEVDTLRAEKMELRRALVRCIDALEGIDESERSYGMVEAIKVARSLLARCGGA